MKLRPRRKRPAAKAKESRAWKAKLVRVGNSCSVKLPPALVKQSGLGNEVMLRVDGRSIVIAPADDNPREGWEEAMKKAIAEHGNELTEEDREWLDAPLDTEFDEKEWQW